MTRPAAGFSLVEVAIAVLLTALIALAAVHQLVGSRQVESAVDGASDRAQTLDLGADLLVQEVRRAGYVPYPAPSEVALDPSEPSLVLTVRRGLWNGDVVRVRYVDDGVASGPRLRDLRFDVGRDRRGATQLYRATDGGNRQPLVQGVHALQVVGWVDVAGLHARDELVAGTIQPWTLMLAASADGDAQRAFAAPLPSRPRTEVVVGP